MATLRKELLKASRAKGLSVTLTNHGDLYCIPFMMDGKYSGFTCLGFDVAIKWAMGYYKWLKSEGQDVEPPDVSLRGTLPGYYDYRRLADRASAYNVRTGKKCPSQLLPQLIGLEGKRVEVVTTYGETRRFQVGKSTGWCPCHLEIANRAAHGGMSAEHEYKSVRQV